MPSVNEQPIPDVYTDSASIFLNDWGITIDLRVSVPPEILPTVDQPNPTQISSERRATIRMSHAHAKAFSIILKRHLKSYEQQPGSGGFIKLPDRVMEGLKLTAEDW